MFRIGQGYDVHRLVEGRELWLCGVKIDTPVGLLGHSDADVATHALCDALLGALALGDIGKHFPDTDPRFKGISSIVLLEHVCSLVAVHGYETANADITIIAQQPKLAPHIQAMRLAIADAMRTDIGNISVKATTTEHLGFEGRKEGISALAIVLLKKCPGH